MTKQRACKRRLSTGGGQEKKEGGTRVSARRQLTLSSVGTPDVQRVTDILVELMKRDARDEVGKR